MWKNFVFSFIKKKGWGELMFLSWGVGVVGTALENNLSGFSFYTCLPTALTKPGPSFLIPLCCPWKSYGGDGRGRGGDSWSICHISESWMESLHLSIKNLSKLSWLHVSLLLGVLMLFPGGPPCFSRWLEFLMAVHFVFDYYRMIIKVSFYFIHSLV